MQYHWAIHMERSTSARSSPTSLEIACRTIRLMKSVLLNFGLRSVYQISHLTSLLILPIANYCVPIQLGSSSQIHEITKVNIPIGCNVCDWGCVVYKVVANCN